MNSEETTVLPVNEEVLQLLILYPQLSRESCEQLYVRYGGTADSAANGIIDDMMKGNFSDIADFMESLSLNNKENSTAEKSPEWVKIGPPSRRPGSDLGNSLGRRNSGKWKSSKDVRILRIPQGISSEEEASGLLQTMLQSGPETKRLIEEVALGVYPKLLIIMRGVPGSGKSSVASTLYSVTNSAIICSADNYFRDRHGNYNFNPGLLDQAHRQCKDTCRKGMEKEISPIIVDNTNTKRIEMEPYVELAIRNHYYIRVMEPETPWKNDPKLLAKKNVHGVPKTKIQDMLRRYEQISPHTLVNDVKKKLKDVGLKYNPPPKLLSDSDNLDDRFIDPGSPSARRSSIDLINMQFPIGSPLHKEIGKVAATAKLEAAYSPPPVPKLTEFFHEGMLRQGERKRGRSRSGSSVRGPAKCTDSPSPLVGRKTLDSPPSTEEEDHEGSSPTDTLLKFFPDCGREELIHLFQMCNGDLNETISNLLDSGYIMNGDENTRRQSECESNNAAIAAVINKQSDEFPLVDWDVNETAPGMIKNELEFGVVESERYRLEGARPKTSNFSAYNMPDQIVPLSEPWFNDFDIPDENFVVDEDENDGEDWIDLNLPEDFIKILSNMYGEPNGKNLSSITKEERKIRLPPATAFDLFRYLSINITKCENKKEEQTLFESANNNISQNEVSEQIDDDFDECDDMDKILQQIQEMESSSLASGEPYNFQAIVEEEEAARCEQVLKLEELRNIKRSMAQNIKFAQLRHSFPSLKSKVVDDIYVQCGLDYSMALASLRELYPLKYQTGEVKAKEKAVCKSRSRYPDNSEMKYDPDKVSVMTASEKREMLDLAQHWRLQFEELLTSTQLYKDQAKNHRSQPEVFSYYMVKAAETKRLMLSAQKEHWFYTVIGLNAGNKNPNKIDLHGLSVQNALEVVNNYLENRKAWVKNHVPLNTLVSVNIITGIGRHSVDNLPKINPAVRNFLMHKHYSFNDSSNGSFNVQLIFRKDQKGKTKKK